MIKGKLYRSNNYCFELVPQDPGAWVWSTVEPGTVFMYLGLVPSTLAGEEGLYRHQILLGDNVWFTNGLPANRFLERLV